MRVIVTAGSEECVIIKYFFSPLEFFDVVVENGILLSSPLQYGQNQVFDLQRSPYYRGRECICFLASLGPNELWRTIERCPYYRGVRKERLDCTLSTLTHA